MSNEPEFVRDAKGVQEFWGDCVLKGQATKPREKYLRDCVGVFKNVEETKKRGDELAYWVINQNFNREHHVLGNLQWGITYLKPITVDGECNMTSGHFHVNHECDEYYYTLRGTGFLLFWDGHEDFYAEKMYPGSLHYINGKYAHRIINSGEDLLAVAACSLPSTIQDHDSIRRHGFPYRCYKRNGEIVWEKQNEAD